MQKILVALSAFTDKGNDEGLTKVDLRKPAPIPNIPNLETPTTFKAIFPKIDVPEPNTSGDEVPDHLADLNSKVSEAALEIGKLPDRITRYQLRRVAQMSVRYENNTMPDENI